MKQYLQFEVHNLAEIVEECKKLVPNKYIDKSLAGEEVPTEHTGYREPEQDSMWTFNIFHDDSGFRNNPVISKFIDDLNLTEHWARTSIFIMKPGLPEPNTPTGFTVHTDNITHHRWSLNISFPPESKMFYNFYKRRYERGSPEFNPDHELDKPYFLHIKNENLIQTDEISVDPPTLFDTNMAHAISHFGTVPGLMLAFRMAHTFDIEAHDLAQIHS